jgi:hypothetical protein
MWGSQHSHSLQFSEHEYEDLDYFLGCYFHTLALVTIMEHILLGIMDPRAQHIVERAIQAEEVFSLSTKKSWNYRRTSLFTALALLLVQQIYENKEGNGGYIRFQFNYRIIYSKASPSRCLVSTFQES